MYSEIEQHVTAAAAEFRAAADAITSEARRKHRAAAEDWVMLIQCHGSLVARRVLKARAAAKAPSAEHR